MFALRFREPGMLDSTGMKPAEAAIVVVLVVRLRDSEFVEWMSLLLKIEV